MKAKQQIDNYFSIKSGCPASVYIFSRTLNRRSLFRGERYRIRVRAVLITLSRVKKKM